MRKVIILGSGAHAAEIEQYIVDNNSRGENIALLGFVSPSRDSYEKYSLRHPYLGSDLEMACPSKDAHLILGFSNIEGRLRLITDLKAKGYSFMTFVHHSSFVFPTAKLGEGCVICPFCQIGPNVELNSFNTLNNKVNIGHDSKLGVNNVLCPNVGLSGNTIVGDNNFFSINVATIPNVKIGSSNVIAPNMVIEKNIDSNVTFFHRFKEVVLAIPKT
jgi:acetyltransferase-like isoleucine patch superfamily enzyme